MCELGPEAVLKNGSKGTDSTNLASLRIYFTVRINSTVRTHSVLNNRSDSDLNSDTGDSIIVSEPGRIGLDHPPSHVISSHIISFLSLLISSHLTLSHLIILSYLLLRLPRDRTKPGPSPVPYRPSVRQQCVRCEPRGDALESPTIPRTRTRDNCSNPCCISCVLSFHYFNSSLT
jgi:hypothetical protein